MKELEFVGIKITPIAHAVHLASKDRMHVFEVARSLGVPVMVHTGSDAPFADPISLVNVLKSFKDIKRVLAHVGSDFSSSRPYILPASFTMFTWNQVGLVF